MKFFVLFGVLFIVVVLSNCFDETRIGHPASFGFSLLPQQDIFAMSQSQLEESQDTPEPGTRSRSRGFIPQVRVGRSGNYHIPGASKRATKMTVFPRVGRNSPKLYTGSDCDNRHATRDTSSGLWFGPRLGVHKRDDYEMPLSYILMNGGHGTRMEYIPFPDKDFESDGDNEKLNYGSLN